ncbi:hypothetical protein ES705_21154 [subsurface metagenome]
MIHSNKLKRINGEFSRLNLYSLSVRQAGIIPTFQYSSEGVPMAQYSRITTHYPDEPFILTFNLRKL